MLELFSLKDMRDLTVCPGARREGQFKHLLDPGDFIPAAPAEKFSEPIVIGVPEKRFTLAMKERGQFLLGLEIW